MNKGELVSRISNQLRAISKDDYISSRFILRTAESIARKFITQKIQRRSIDRDSSMYREMRCIEFEKVDIFSCKHVEFKSCIKLSKSINKITDLIFTRYGSSVKELYSIDRQVSFTESTLYQLRIDSERHSYMPSDTKKFYILDNHIYIPEDVKVLSGLILSTDHYDLEESFGCEKECKSAWDYEFICPDSMLEDVIGYTIQNISATKQIPEDEKPDLSNNTKQ